MSAIYLAPTIFPVGRVSHGRSMKQCLGSVITSGNHMKVFVEALGISAPNVFCLAWALTLKYYLGTEHPCFGYQGPNDNGVDPLGAVYQFHFENISITELLRALESRADSKYFEECPLNVDTTVFNTFLCVNAAPKEPFGNEQGLSLAIDLTRDQFEASITVYGLMSVEIHLILDTFNAVLDSLITNPNMLPNQLPNLGAENLSQVQRWNSQLPQKVDTCLHYFFHQKAQFTPQSIAISAWDGEMTYKELDDISSSIARYLIRLGVQVEDAVPHFFEKSKWAIVAMLAILKAGGASTALNIEHPQLRLLDMCKHLKAEVALTSELYSSKVQQLELVGIAVAIGPNLFSFLLNDKSLATVSLPQIRPSNMAFIVFTSGSTGKPKGSILEHAAICTSLTLYATNFGINSNTRMLQFAAFTFDVSLSDIFAPLLQGGCVTIPSEEDRLNQLAQAANDLKANTASLTPTVAKWISPEEVLGIEKLILAGEPITQDNVATWTSHVSLHNCFGPSECGPISTCQTGIGIGEDLLTIGCGVGSTWITVPNDPDRLVPVGCVGELLFEGPTLAREYLNDPERTAKSFIINPKWAIEGGERRFYRTGDLVQYNLDGSLRFLGRKDSQVKIGGQRLELGEVEYHLTHCNSILRDGIACCPVTGPYGHRLVAILALMTERSTSSHVEVACDSNRDMIADELEKASIYLGERLPSYMVPTVWIVIKKLPTLASGKLNRSLLQTWVEGLDDQSCEAIASSTKHNVEEEIATTDVEKILLSTWSEVLNIPVTMIGLQSSFMKIGGDSITAMEVVRRARLKKLGFTTRDIMQCKTIARLALTVKCIYSKNVAPFNEDDEYQLSPIQHFFFQKYPSGENHFNQHFYLKLGARKSVHKLRYALQTLVLNHPMLRARFICNSGSWTYRIAPASPDAFWCQCFKEQGNKSAIIANFSADMNITNGPIFGAAIMETKEDQTMFLVAHHLVIDSISWQIIVDDLEQMLSQGSFDFPERIMFPAWITAQSSYHHGRSYTLPFQMEPSNYGFWGMVGHPNRQADAKEITFNLDHNVTSKLVGAANDAFGTKVKDILLAAIIFSFRTTFPEQPMPTVFDEGHSRNIGDSTIDFARTVGCFSVINPLILEGKFEDHLLEYVRRTKDTRRKLAELPNHFTSQYLHAQGEPDFSYYKEMEILCNHDEMYEQQERGEVLLDCLSPDHLDVQSHTVGQSVQRNTLFKIESKILNGQLRVSFQINNCMQHQPRISLWIECYRNTLNTLAQVLVLQPAQYTLSDFPLQHMGYEGLKLLMEDRLPKLGIEASKVEDVYPCSPMQQGLLISQTKNQEVYATQLLWKIKCMNPSDDIDFERLEQAWQKVVDRHAALRTLFIDSVSEDAMFDQVVLKKVLSQFEHISAINEATGLEKMQRLSITRKATLESPMPFIRLCRIDSSHALLSLDFNHALGDGYSLDVILSELQSAYIVPSRSEPGSLYSAYIKYLQQQNVAEQTNYWLSQLSGVKPCLLSLPAGNITNTSKALKVCFPYQEQMRDFCRQEGLTSSTVLQATWSLVLMLYVGTNDPCFGLINSGRDIHLEGVDTTVGAFINMVVNFSHLKPENTILQTLHRLQEISIESLPYQACSLAHIQSQLPELDGPLFNTMMTIKKATNERLSDTNGLTFERIELHSPVEYDIAIEVEEKQTETVITLTYWTAKLAEEQATRIVNTFGSIISSVLDNPLQKIQELDVISANDKAQIFAWNDVPLPTLKLLIHSLVEKHFSTQPNRQAVCAWDGSFTYSQLDAITNKVAYYLTSRYGIGPGKYVPYSFEKSKWAVVAVLSILRAGAAFVPLDVSYPITRLQSIVTDIQATVVLTSPLIAQNVSSLAQSTVVLDELFVDSLVHGVVAIQPSPEDNAYALFTSGSTGKPKGVVVQHAAYSTAAQAHQKQLRLSPSSRVFQFSSYAFDASVFEIVTTLTVGGCVCIMSDDERMNDLIASMNRLQINTAALTPAVSTLITPDDVPLLKVITLGAEPLTQENIATWSQQKDIFFQGTYGPTEACVVCMAQNFERQDHPLNIGFGFSVRVWIVDAADHNKLCLIGKVGEMLLEGPVLAKEYLHDQAKTAAAFINNPKWAQSPEGESRRFYKTGDLGCYNSDGSIQFCGRKDFQVKLRGQRIELGEIEENIASLVQPYNWSCAVELVKPPNEKQSLAAFVFKEHGIARTVEEEEKPSAEDASRLSTMESKLKSILPSYMIPSMFFLVKETPLTINLKLDRSLLRTFAERHTSPRKRSVANNESLSLAEGKLCNLWAEVFSREVVSISKNDNFFHIGGDSLHAMQLGAKARAAGIILTVSDMFKKPKLVDMALACSTFSIAGTINSAFSLLQDSDKREAIHEACLQCSVGREKILDIYPATPLQEGIMGLSMKTPGSYVATLVFELPSNLDVVRLKSAWQATVISQPILRTRLIHSESAGFLQVVLDETVTWEEGSCLARFNNSHSVLPGFGSPLLNFGLVEQNRFLVLKISHVIYDGWSFPLLLRAVEQAYKGEKPSAVVPFQNFLRILISRDRKAESNFWKSQLADFNQKPFPPFESGFPKPDPSGLETRTIIFERTRNYDFTTATIVRGAWAMAQAQAAGVTDIVFGISLNGRNAPVEGVGQIAAPLLTTVPVRVTIHEGETVTDFLQHLQQQSADMMEYEQTGLRVIKKLGAGASVACSFNTLVIIQTNTHIDTTLLGIVPDFFNDTPTADYGLVVEITPQGDEVSISAHYDGQMLAKQDLQTLLHDFEKYLLLLGNGDLATIAEVYAADAKIHPNTESNRSFDLLQMCLHHRFEQQAWLSGSAIAIDDGHATISYEELNRFSTKLALDLASRGVGPEILVSLCFRPSPWAIVAMLAVLKAGGAWVHISPNDIAEHGQSIHEHIHAKAMLCGRDVANDLKSFISNVLVIDQEFLRSTKKTTRGPVCCTVLPSNAAYAKVRKSGVRWQISIIEHASLATSSILHERHLSLTRTSRVLHTTSYDSNLALLETITPLCLGACICIAGDLENTFQAIQDTRSSWAILKSSELKYCLPSTVPTLQVVVICNDDANPQTASTWSQSKQMIKIYNQEEACAIVAVNDLRTHVNGIGHTLHGFIGVADPEDFHLLSQSRSVGNVVLAGPLLPRASVTLEDKSSSTAWFKDNVERNCRYLKTGDRAHYDSDGNIVVLSFSSTSTSRAESSASDIGSDVSVSGATSVDSQEPFQMTNLLKSKWAKTLKLDITDLQEDDNFLALGGDSLDAMQLVADLRRVSVLLTVAEIFSKPVLKDMALLCQYMVERPSEHVIKPFTLLEQAEEIINLAKTFVSRETIEDIYPCTPMQEGLMALSLKQSGTYVAREVFLVPESLDLPRFRRAWEDVYQACSILRTRIIQSESLQCFAVVVSEPLTWFTSESLHDYVAKDKEEKFTFGCHLSCFTLIKDGDLTYFALTAHHAIYDGWSLPRLYQLVLSIYNGGSVSIPSVQMSNFIRYLRQQDQRQTDTFWTDQLKGWTGSAFPCLKDPQYLPRANSLIEYKISLPVEARLQEVSLPIIIRGAWALVLSKYTDTQDVVFGANLFGRNAAIANIEDLMGPTLTTVPIRIVLDYDLDVASYLNQLHRQSVLMIPFEHTGLRNIASLASVPNEACAFNNTLMIQLSQNSDGGFSTLGIETARLATDISHTFPLMMECILEEDGISVCPTFDSTLIGKVTMQRMLYQFQHILLQLLSASSSKKLRELSFTSEQDISLINTWNSDLSPPVNRCIHGMVNASIVSSPHAMAVCAADGELTYAELGQLSSRLAEHLASLGVGPEVIVPFCFEKSKWAVVAQLAILNAGGVIVALSPSQPIERLKGIVADIEATIVLTSSTQYDFTSALGKNTIVIDETLFPSLLPYSGYTSKEVRPSNAAIVVYTSGSTGHPKGIVLEHIGLSTTLKVMGVQQHVSPTSRVFQFASYTFDVSYGETFAALIHGACICIPSEEERASDIVRCMKSLSVTYASLTPSVMAMMRPEDVPSLEVLTIGGEQVGQEVIDLWADKLCFNIGYGPAECSINANYNVGPYPRNKSANIGRAEGCVFWITDSNNTEVLVPVGSVGELIIEGPIVGRGYLKDAQKTSAAFISKPTWAMDRGQLFSRFYRTGDLAMYDADGSVILLGRKDTQIKMYSQRIEVGEIEFHLQKRLPKSWLSCVDVIKPDCKNGDPVLVAYIFLVSGIPFNDDLGLEIDASDGNMALTAQLTAHLKSTVPTYMVPSVFLYLKTRPFNINGKTDRMKLRKLAQLLSADTLTSMVAGAKGLKQPPSTPIEITMQTLWSKTLKVQATAIGINDSFFQLGGDSMSAMRLISNARVFGIHFSVTEIFSNPTLGALCEILVERQSSIQPQTAQQPYRPFVYIGNQDRDEFIRRVVLPYIKSIPDPMIEDVSLTTTVQKAVLLHGLLKTRGHSNYCVITMEGHIDHSLLEKACYKIVQAHPIFRSVFVPCGQDMLQVTIQNFPVEFREYELHGDLETFVTELTEKDKTRSEDFGNAILRFLLIKENATRCALIIRISHAQYDGSSFATLLKDLRDAYLGAELKPSPSFALYVHKISENLEEKYNFWRHYLHGSKMTNILNRSGPIYKNVNNDMVERTIPFAPLRCLGISDITILKAAWACVLAEESRASDVVFGIISSGRDLDLPDIDRMMGQAAHKIPVRVTLNKEDTVLVLLNHIQRQSAKVFAYQHVGLEEISAKCVDWPTTTRFSSMISHQALEMTDNKLSIGEIQCVIKGIVSTYDSMDFCLLTLPHIGEGKLTVSGAFSNLCLPTPYAWKLLDKFCFYITLLTTAYGKPLPDLWKPEVHPPAIPIIVHEEMNHGGSKTTTSLPVPMNARPATKVYASLETIVKKACKKILPLAHGGDIQYDVKGDLLAAAKIATYYRRKDFAVLVEDVLENTTLESQINMLVLYN